MDLHVFFKFLIFISTYSILFIGAVPFFLNGTYNGYTLIMYFTDDNTRNPMTLNSSFAENWCSSIGATLPRITDDAEQKNIVDFIRSATQKYELDRIKRIFVNNIYHTVGNWTWLNGRRNHGFTVRYSSSNETFLGYLNIDYLIYPSLPNATRGYICEAYKPSSNFSNCEMRLDSRCYWAIYDVLTWHKARNSCLNVGGDLASFDAVNDTDLKDSLKGLRVSKEKGFWVGLSKSVWRWNDKGNDSEVKYSNWKLNSSSNYNVKCLCLDKSSSYEWIGCDCDEEYSFICKRNGISMQIPLTTNEQSFSSVIAETSAKSLPKDSMLLTKSSAISDTLAESRKTDQTPSASVTPETVRLALVLSSCALIVIIILVVAAFIIRKQRSRPVNSSRYKSFVRGATTTANEIPVYATVRTSTINESTANNWSASNTTFGPVNSCSYDDTSAPRITTTGNVIPIYAEIEEARGTQSTANWSPSKTTYAIIQPGADTSQESEANSTEYANLDLPQRKK